MKTPILLYHMIGTAGNAKEKRYTCPPERFRKQMAYLKSSGYSVIKLEELVNSIINGHPLSMKSVVITFDDGFKDNYENAFPILKEYGYPATIFVVSGLVGSTNKWMEHRGFSQKKLASWEEIMEMAENGIEIGSHTITHADMDRLDVDINDELADSKKEIEGRLERPVRFFAYPYGRMNDRVRSSVATAGYMAACSTRSGFNSAGADPFILRRIEVYGTDSLWRFALKIAWGTNDANLAIISRYYLSRLQVRLKKQGSAWT